MSSRKLTVEESHHLRRKVSGRFITITGRMSFVSQRKKCRYVQSAIGARRGKPDQADLVRDTVKIGTSILLDVLEHWLIGSDLRSLAL